MGTAVFSSLQDAQNFASKMKRAGYHTKVDSTNGKHTVGFWMNPEEERERLRQLRLSFLYD